MWEQFDKFENIVKKYMPDTGEGETKASQIVTAVNKLIYKYFNDGDVFDNSYRLEGWANDLSDFANWLSEYAPRTRIILCRIKDARNEEDYEQLLLDLANLTLNEDYLSQFAKEEKIGSIYDCDGEFKFCEYSEEDEEDW